MRTGNNPGGRTTLLTSCQTENLEVLFNMRADTEEQPGEDPAWKQ
jgi:hypothetical protein